MSHSARKHADDLRGAAALAVMATEGITDVVEEMHRTIASGPAVLGRPLAVPARIVTSLMYAPMRRITRLVGIGLDAALAQLGSSLGESTPGPEREAAVSALNGVVGDYLAETENPLAIPMVLRHGGRTLTLTADA